MTAQPPKTKILTRLRINEVSLVDRGAGESCRVVISKRDDSVDEEFLKRNGTGYADHEPADSDDENPFLGIFKGTNKSFAAVARGDEADRKDEATPVDEIIGPAPPPDGAVEGDPVETITFDVGDKTFTARNERALARWLS